MGNQESSSTAPPLEPVLAPHSSHYKELYSDLTAPESQDGCVAVGAFRVSLVYS